MMLSTNEHTSRRSFLLARVSTGSAAVAVIALGVLHFTDPEIDPSWHMISEYAYGPNGWILTVFFLCWGISSWIAAAAVFPLMKGVAGKTGVVLLALAGTGAIMGGLFDVRHELHGAAFGLGVPSLPIAALLISTSLKKRYALERTRLMTFAHATWISVIVMAAAMVIFISGLKSAGAFDPEAKTMLTMLPDGVIAMIGYTNRLLVLSYLAWVIAVDKTIVNMYNYNAPSTNNI